MAGEAIDAISVCTQFEKGVILPDCWTECPAVSIRLPRNRRQKDLDNIEERVVPLARNSYGHPLAGFALGEAIGVGPIARRLGESS